MLSIEIAQSFGIKFWASWYITWLNREFELKVTFIEFPQSFWYHFERLEIFRDSIGHPSKKLLSLEFAHSFCILFRASRCISVLDKTSELKVIVVWICSELLFSISGFSIYYRTQSDSELNVIVVCICYDLPFSILSVSIYYGTQSDIRVKCYCR